MVKPNFGIYGSWGVYKHYEKSVSLKPWIIFIGGHGGGYPGESDVTDDNGIGLTSPALIAKLRHAFPNRKLCVAYKPSLAKIVKDVDYWWLGDEMEMQFNGVEEFKALMATVLSYNSTAKFAHTFGGETSQAWSPEWLSKVKALIESSRHKDLMVMNYGYGLYTANHIHEKYRILAELLGTRVTELAWGVGTPKQEERIELLWTAYNQAKALEISKLVYWDLAPARKDLDILWFGAEGNLNGDPWCLVDYSGNPLPGYNTINYFNHL